MAGVRENSHSFLGIRNPWRAQRLLYVLQKVAGPRKIKYAIATSSTRAEPEREEVTGDVCITCRLAIGRKAAHHIIRQNVYHFKRYVAIHRFCEAYGHRLQIWHVLRKQRRRILHFPTRAPGLRNFSCLPTPLPAARTQRLSFCHRLLPRAMRCCLRRRCPKRARFKKLELLAGLLEECQKQR